VFEWLVSRYTAGCRLAILETPAGFELNSPAVAGRIADYFQRRLKNHLPEIRVVPARAKGSKLGPDNPEVIKPLATADLIFMGPGSPTYAIRQLRESLAWELIQERLRQGACLALASSAVIAIGKYALPVYEIYKVGEDLHWLDGLDFLGPLGLDLVVIPHWNNRDGGEELDTSHCFMGASRFNKLQRLLSDNSTLVGLDELTTLVIDLAGERCQIMGAGQVHILRDGRAEDYQSGDSFALAKLGDFRSDASFTPPSPIVDQLMDEEKMGEVAGEIPAEVLALVEERRTAREQADWETADRCREKIESLGWQITDTGEGFRLTKK
jgi:hypothetical protein